MLFRESCSKIEKRVTLMRFYRVRCTLSVRFGRVFYLSLSQTAYFVSSFIEQEFFFSLINKYHIQPQIPWMKFQEQKFSRETALETNSQVIWLVLWHRLDENGGLLNEPNRDVKQMPNTRNNARRTFIQERIYDARRRGLRRRK